MKCYLFLPYTDLTQITSLAVDLFVVTFYPEFSLIIPNSVKYVANREIELDFFFILG